MPSAVDEFSEEFAGYPITSSIDFYAGYNQIPLAAQSRDLISFIISLGLLCSIRLLTGWTNSVSVFQRIMIKILWLYLRHTKPFLDDVGIHGPDKKDEILVIPGIRKFMLEYMEILEGIMRDI
jgi:hypothetical protein